MGKWKKLGLIFKPDKSLDWMQSHATTPVPIHMEEDTYRIFFSSRNILMQNQLGYLDIDLRTPQDIKGMSLEPSLSLGPLGFFDCDGMYMNL